MVGSPEIGGQKAGYDSGVAEKYDANTTVEAEKKRQEQQKLDETALLADVYYEQLYNDPKVTQSSYSFLTSETYNDTDINDKTDTYVNMNTSYRYIKYNINKAGDRYNELYLDCDYKKDSPKKVFDAIIKKLKLRGYDKIHKNGKWEQNLFTTDLDFMYALGLFQAVAEKSGTGTTNLSKKDFRVGPKTLIALLQIGTPLKTATIETPIIKVPIIKSPIVVVGTDKIPAETVIDKASEHPGTSEQEIINKAIAGSKLSDGKDKNSKINTFDEVYDFTEDALENYIEGKITSKERKAMNKTFKEKIKDFANSKNPYFAAYTRLVDDIETQWKENKIAGYDKVLSTKIVYLLTLMTEMQAHDKDITYDPAFTLRGQISEGDRSEVMKGVDMNDTADIIALIKQDKKFATTENKDKIPLTSFSDVLNVYNAALDNYRKDKNQEKNN
ncbi:MAG: hypothetical protein NT085_03110 [candidate division SR1 bacterium]|nr:hypothetical protein [candidate division SR1 bacterium]